MRHSGNPLTDPRRIGALGLLVHDAHTAAGADPAHTRARHNAHNSVRSRPLGVDAAQTCHWRLSAHMIRWSRVLLSHTLDAARSY